MRESLCTLYVAMTRARHALYMLVDELRTTKGGAPSEQGLRTLAGVVRCALARADAKADEIAFSAGDAAWMISAKAGVAAPASEGDAPRRIALATSLFDSITRGWSAAAASAASHGGVLAQSLRQLDDEARDRGIAMHAAFQRIDWADRALPDDAALRAAVLGAAPRRGAAWADAVAAQVRAALGRDAVRRAMSLNGADERSRRLHRELPFARLVDGRLQRGAIDRLVVEVDGNGQPRRGTVIDFKTDDVDEAAAMSQAERYRPQLQVYREAAAEMFGLKVEDVGAKLIFVSAGVVVDAQMRQAASG